MAGAGYKLFQTGDVLTAAQVNTYLNEQTVMVFANSTARTSALTSVLAEGMVTYLQDTNAVEVYNGSAWVSIGSSGDITGVTAGTGLSGGGTSGDVTLSLSIPVTEVSGGTNQTTYATGDVLYASGTNTLAKRAIGTTGQVLTVSGGVPTWATPSSSATFVGCKVYKTTEQSIPNASWTDLTWDAESWDTDAFHSTSTNTARLTIPTGKGGKYLVTTQPGWVANSTGSRNTRILLNNNTAVALGNWTMALTTGDATYHANSHILNLSAGDYITIQIGQGSGGNLNTASGEANINASITYLGA